jgi:ethanolamine kinase
MSELDYGLYPSREMQLEWLRVYLHAYKASTKKGEEVSDRELETLYVQVNKFALVRNTLSLTPLWSLLALFQTHTPHTHTRVLVLG